MLTTDEILQNWRDFVADRPAWFSAFEDLRRRHPMQFDIRQRAIAQTWDRQFPDRPPTAAELAWVLGERKPWVARIYPHIERLGA